jgi:hypothetical protein
VIVFREAFDDRFAVLEFAEEYLIPDIDRGHLQGLLSFRNDVDPAHHLFTIQLVEFSFDILLSNAVAGWAAMKGAAGKIAFGDKPHPITCNAFDEGVAISGCRFWPTIRNWFWQDHPQTLQFTDAVGNTRLVLNYVRKMRIRSSVMRWNSNNDVPPIECVALAAHIGLPVDIAQCTAIRDAETQALGSNADAHFAINILIERDRILPLVQARKCLIEMHDHPRVEVIADVGNRAGGPSR